MVENEEIKTNAQLAEKEQEDLKKTEEIEEKDLPKEETLKQRFKTFFEKIFKSKSTIEEEKKVRENLSEKQIDKMVKDSFPASDPPSTY